MRVLGVVPLYPPHSRVGSWLATHQFLAHLALRGHDVTVATMMANQPPYVLDQVKVVGGLPGRDNELRAQWADVIVSHCGDHGYGTALAARHGKPSVRMAHGTDTRHIGHAALVVFNSRSLAAATGWDGPQIVCHPPVFAAKHRARRGQHVTLVNCSVEKGIGTFTAIAKRRNDRYLAVLGGHGTQKRVSMANVRQIGPTQDMRRDVWSQTRVLLMPSQHETWGMVGVEAMCSGIPVIAHPTPGLREALGPAGIFVDRDDIDGWCEALAMLDDRDAYQAASRRAFDRAAELDPGESLLRFVDAVEAIPTGKPAPEPAVVEPPARVPTRRWHRLAGVTA